MKASEKSPKAAAKKLARLLRAAYRVLRSLLELELDAPPFSCRRVDPSRSFYTPNEVEFSCSNTPAASFFHHASRRRRRRGSRCRYKCDAEAVAKAFEILNSQLVKERHAFAATPSPVPAIVRCIMRSPAVVRELRVTDSPFLTEEEGGETGCHVDDKAGEFIRRFYEQLRSQWLADGSV